MSNWVINHGTPPYVIPRGSAGLKKMLLFGGKQKMKTVEKYMLFAVFICTTGASSTTDVWMPRVKLA